MNMKQASLTIVAIIITFLLFSCSSIPIADLSTSSPYAMLVTLDIPGEITSPIYYIKNNTIKQIGNGLQGLLLNQYAFIYLKQTPDMDNPDLIYQNMETNQTIKINLEGQSGTIISLLSSPSREKIIIHIWPDGIATGNNVYVMLNTNDLLNLPEKNNLKTNVIKNGEKYETIKWIAAVADDGSLVYIGSNGAPDEGIVYRDKSGKETIITKYKEIQALDSLIIEGIHPPYNIAEIFDGEIYLLGTNGVWTFTPQTASLTLKYPLDNVEPKGFWLDRKSQQILVWGLKLGKVTMNIYDTEGGLIKSISDVRYIDPRIINGEIFAITFIKEKTIYSYAIGNLIEDKENEYTLNRIFISQNDIKWWDITDKE